MASNQIARQYRELAIRSATPVGLIVLLYDMAIESLAAAAREIDAGNIEGRTLELNYTLSIICELQRSLNFEKGGEVAKQFLNFYDVSRNKILEANIQSSKEIVERLSGVFCSVREAWQVAERNPNAQPATRPAIANANPPSPPESPSDRETERTHLQWSA